MEFNIEKFVGLLNFSIWQMSLTDIILQSGLEAVIEECDSSYKMPIRRSMIQKLFL